MPAPLSLPSPCLCLVTDPSLCPPDELPGRVAAAVAGGVNLVQLRDKDAPGGALLRLALSLKALCHPDALLLINERADLAVAAGADGIQLGERAMPTAAARRVVGPSLLIGRSVHSVAGALFADAAGADFLIVGTMFATRSHPGQEPSGPGLLSRIRAAGVAVPLIAIGGITVANLPDVMRAGAVGVAVITSILSHRDPQSAARRLKSALLEHAASRPAPLHQPPARLIAPSASTGVIAPNDYAESQRQAP